MVNQLEIPMYTNNPCQNKSSKDWYCTLDKAHTGPHIATDMAISRFPVLYQVWGDDWEETTWRRFS